MKVEYLVIKKDNELDSFCSDKSSFINLLMADSRISINDNKLVWNNNLEVTINIETDLIGVSSRRYFLVEIVSDNKDNIEEFSQLDKEIKVVLSKFGISQGSFNTLWNDLSNMYSIDSYILINKIENLMRKLISKFMLITVGPIWINENIPHCVKQTIDNKTKDSTFLIDPLHSSDFIDLANFLFEPYRKKSLNMLDNMLNKTKEKEIKVEELKDLFSPQSNWDKFFVGIVKTDGMKLKKDWESLYKLRNKVAHNNLIDKGDFDQIKKLTAKLESILNKAINEIAKIKLSKEEYDNLIIRFFINDKEIGGKILEWYIKKSLHRAIDISSKDCHFKLTLRDNKIIAAQINFLNIFDIESVINDILENINQVTDIINNSKYDEYHIILIIEGDLDNENLNKLKLAKQKLIDYNSNIKFIVGYYDGEKIDMYRSFTPVFN